MNTKANLQKALASLMVLAVLTSCTLNKGLDEIETAEGLISGVRNESGDVLIFKAVPFAAPPIGDLRWRGPQPVKPWDGVRLCDKWSASPFQNKPVPFSMYTKEWIPPPEPISEDCLYLNIWTPAKYANEKLPVLVWIYGGAFISGSGAVPIYDGEALAKQGIVYVGINYRLGIFGFMAHPELTQESQYSSSGNYGLMDQQAALMWIQKNISAFGGDPARVTIAGSSAGSISVNALVASPLSKGMFHGAIAQSGGIFPDFFSNSLKTTEGIGAEVMKKANASNLNELRKLSADTLLKIANTFPFYSFSPFVDRYLIRATLFL